MEGGRSDLQLCNFPEKSWGNRAPLGGFRLELITRLVRKAECTHVSTHARTHAHTPTDSHSTDGAHTHSSRRPVFRKYLPKRSWGRRQLLGSPTAPQLCGLPGPPPLMHALGWSPGMGRQLETPHTGAPLPGCLLERMLKFTTPLSNPALLVFHQPPPPSAGFPAPAQPTPAQPAIPAGALTRRGS